MLRYEAGQVPASLATDQLTERTSSPPAGRSPCPTAAKPSVKSLEQAAQWYATLRDDSATEQDRQAWQAWLDASPEHALAWETIETISRKFDPLRGNGPQGPAAAVAGVEVARRAISRRHVVNRLTNILGLSVLGWLGWRHTPLPKLVQALRSDFHTGTGERREVLLADGTRVWLNTSTALKVDYAGAERLLVLLAGEILIETASDSQQRPFFVKTGFGRMQALGTRFTVRHTDTLIRLDVFDGTVEVRTTAGTTQRVKAGQAARFGAAGISERESADRVREAWSKGRLPADNMPLAGLLEELSRYRRGHISVAPEVADIRVMGVYPADDPDRALAMLEQNLPIRVHRTLPWWTTVEAR